MKIKLSTRMGLFLLRLSRRLLAIGRERCWYCGVNPGMGILRDKKTWCYRCDDTTPQSWPPT